MTPEELRALLSPVAPLRLLPVGATMADVEQALREFAEALRGQDELARAVAAEEALSELERLKVRRPAQLLEAALRLAGGDAAEMQGQAVDLTDPEPWPEPVDGAALLDELVATIRRYVVLPSEHHARAIALWVLHTHSIDAAQVTPRLAITSPTKRCGKSTLLAVLGALVRRPLPAANITPAALFRGIERYTPTLLVDEGDTFLGDRDELRGLLNAGHYKPSAWVIRTVGDDHEVRRFFVFGPVAIGLIGALPDTLADRSIRVEMRRREPGEHVEPLRLDRLPELEPLRRKAARWASDHLDALKAADPQVPDGLHDRAADNWRPLLAIADAAGGAWLERAREAARVLEQVPDGEDADVRVQLLADIRAIFDEAGAGELATRDLLGRLHDMEDRPWTNWHGRPITPEALARLLKPFDIRPSRRENWRGYRRADFEEAWRRYLPHAHGGEDDEPVRTRQDGAATAFLARSETRHQASALTGSPHADEARRDGALTGHDGFAATGEPAGEDRVVGWV